MLPKSAEVTTERISFRQRLNRWLRRILLGLATLFLSYFLIVLVGLLPTNDDFQPSVDGIEIFVSSSAIHADLVLPIKTDIVNWRDHFSAECFRGNTDSATHVSIGWGDRGFFLETETWEDFRWSTAAKALFWPTGTCMHVEMTRAPWLDDDAMGVKISGAQYRQLVEYILSSFGTNKRGEKTRITGEAYNTKDVFFDAKGKYHCLNTCNSWAGTGMRSVGVRMPWITPLPKTAFLYLPERTENTVGEVRETVE